MGAQRGWKCKHCREMQTRHEEQSENVFVCADGTIATFERFITKPTRRTNSFSKEEIYFADELFRALLQGADLSNLRRRPELKEWARKASTMRKKSEAAAKKEKL